MELSVFAEQAVQTWSMLRRHGSDIDGFSGTSLPIRYEALRMECDRHPAGVLEAGAPLVRLPQYVRPDAQEQEFPAAQGHELFGGHLAAPGVAQGEPGVRRREDDFPGSLPLERQDLGEKGQVDIA